MKCVENFPLSYKHEIHAFISVEVRGPLYYSGPLTSSLVSLSDINSHDNNIINNRVYMYALNQTRLCLNSFIVLGEIELDSCDIILDCLLFV